MVTRHMSTRELVTLMGIARPAAKSGVANLFVGDKALCVPELALHDGPAGLTVSGALAMPAGINLAATWNPRLAAAYGSSVGHEAKVDRVELLQSVEVNLAVNPLWGRNAETLGEDPYLSGVLGAAEARGISSQGVGIIIKHVGVYARELDRIANNSEVSTRALNEVYLAPTRTVIATGDVAGVMCALGELDGVSQCANRGLYGDVHAMGFSGFVKSDDHAAPHVAAAAAAGIGLIKPAAPLALEHALEVGSVTRAELVRDVSSVLVAMFTHHLMGPTKPLRAVLSDSSKREDRVGQQVANESIVLLKNNGVLPLAKSVRGHFGALPLKKTLRGDIVVFGEAADSGSVLSESGSSHVPHAKIVTDLAGLEKTYGSRVSYDRVSVGRGRDLISAARMRQRGELSFSLVERVKKKEYIEVMLGHRAGNTEAVLRSGDRVVGYLSYVGGNGVGSDFVTLKLGRGIHRIVVSWKRGEVAPRMYVANVTAALAAAKKVASRARTAIVVVGEGGGENEDRGSLQLPGYQEALIRAVESSGTKTVVVVAGSGAVASGWAGRAAGVIFEGEPGQFSGTALAKVISGDVDPSAKLVETWPKSTEESLSRVLSSNPSVLNLNAVGGHGLDVGWPWYVEHHVTPAYPFGYGLSYTKFALSNLVMKKVREGWRVGVDVTNTGRRAGREVVEGYVTYPGTSGEPAGQLKSFGSVYLKRGASAEVAMDLSEASLRVYPLGRAELVSGTYTFGAGVSAARIVLSEPFSVH